MIYTQKTFRKILDTHYFKNDQKLCLEGIYDEQYAKADHAFYDQEICLKNYGHICFYIQTWSSLENPQDIGHTPYCINHLEYGGYIITVPKFGELTQEDITKAIRYWLHEALEGCLLIFNVYYNGVHIL